MSAHVLEQLPLWVEGDLAENAAAAVLSHLEDCPSCRAAAEALEESQAWLKAPEPPPFSTADRMALRASVMAELRRERRPSRVRRFSPYALAAAAVLILFASTRFRSTPSVSAPETSRPAMVAPAPTVAATLPQAAPVRVIHRKPAPDPDPIPPGSSLTRIELQTSNPSIRIIWLAKAEPMPQPNPESIDPSTEVP